MDHGIVSRIKANGKISPEQVVVDGTRYPNDRKTKLPGKDIRSAECAVTPDHDECIHLCGFQIIKGFPATFRSFKFHAPGRFYNCAAALYNITHRMRRKRSEEHTSELTSLMRISYTVF